MEELNNNKEEFEILPIFRLLLFILWCGRNSVLTMNK
jgi:hypothetical protein